MEHAPQDKRAFYGSFVPVSTFSAFACAALIAYGLEASLSAEAMNSWGWRVPFLIAAPLGLVGLYLRWRMEETRHSARPWPRASNTVTRRWATPCATMAAPSATWVRSSR
jgi:MFS family permease